MSKKAPLPRIVLPILAAVVQPVKTRLARIEDLLIEMRHEQDVQLKRTEKLQEQVDGLNLKRRTASLKRRTAK